MKNILNNVTLRIHSTKIPGIIMLKEMNKQFDNSGFMSKFVLLLQEYLGFSYEISVGNNRERTEYLAQNKIDLALPFVQSFEKSKVVDFSQPFTIDAIKFIVGSPAKLSAITAIFQPFLIHVWIAIFLTFVLSIVIFYIIFRNDAKLYKRKKAKIEEVAWALFGAFTNQGNELFSPAGKSCQLLVSGWILATFIVTSSYSGALMSFITFPGREFVPRTFSQLAKVATNGDYIVSTNSGGTIISFISESTEGPAADLRKLFELNKMELNRLNGNLATRILKEKYAYIFYDNAIDIFIYIHGSENFVVSEDQLFSSSVGFGMPKRFLYKKEINEAILRFVETGFFMKFKKDEQLEAEKKHRSFIQDNGEIFHSLSVTELTGPFLLLIIGYSLSIIVIFIEIIMRKLLR